MTTKSKSKLNKFSSRITEPASQGASQAMLIATGLDWNDLKKPQIAYRETLTAKGDGQGRHKKQSGGKGQFGGAVRSNA